MNGRDVVTTGLADANVHFDLRALNPGPEVRCRGTTRPWVRIPPPRLFQQAQRAFASRSSRLACPVKTRLIPWFLALTGARLARGQASVQPPRTLTSPWLVRR
jgi:hypothetical protein